MNPALLFLIRRSFVNAIRAKVKRLKNPRYLVPFLIGVVYFGAIFLTRAGGSSARGWSPGDGLPGAGTDPSRVWMEWGFAALVMMFAVSSWVLPTKGSPLPFLEPEVALLFTAPLSRKELVRYKLIDFQKYLLPAPLIFGLLNAGRLGPARTLYLMIGIWLALSILSLHGIGARMTRLSLAEHGAGAWRRQGIPILVVVAYVGFIALTAPPFPSGDSGVAVQDRIAAWLQSLDASPAGKALLPFRLQVRSAMATDLGGFLLDAGALVCLQFLLYRWVLSNDVAFEEAAAAQAEKISLRIAAAKKGRFSTGETGRKPRRNPWRLGLEGSPEIAFAWKSVTEALRSFSPRLLIFMVTSVFIALPIALKTAEGKGTTGSVMLLIAAGTLAGGACLLTIGGPALLGVNLRQDMERVEALKTLPLTGARLVQSSLVGSVLPVAAIQAFLLVVAAILFPGIPKAPAITPAWVIAAAGIGIVVLPCMTALSATVDAASVIFFPAWVKPGQVPVQGGMEGMGYGIVTTLAKAIVFVLGMLLPAGIGVGIAAAGFAIGGTVFGPAAALLGALFAGSCVMAETWVACRFLGARFERLDPAEEGIIA